MDRLQLLGHIETYQTSFEDEYLFIPRVRSLLRNFTNCFSRSLRTGHITASAWIIDNDSTSALLVHHKKLNKWLQPGGHTDGKENVAEEAHREAIEETGLSTIRPVTNQIFDLDIHLIPAHGAVSAHFHYDIRFLFIADKLQPITTSHESHDVKWFDFDQIAGLTNHSRSIERMILKAKQFSCE
ncbi:MAG: NUDIX hydrolase [Cyclobacteriaceae bacterium]|nr:NUDIX hydrolase [Cyclobacteriaceae bacterium]